MKAKLIVLVSVLVPCACANRPESIHASYVSSDKFMRMDCQQLTGRMGNTRASLSDLSRMQDTKANADAVGVFLFGIPFSKLSGDYEGDIARLKGEIEALETAQVKAGCTGNSSFVGLDAQRVHLANGQPSVVDVEAVPGLTERGKEAYRVWLSKAHPRAFVIADGGLFHYTWSRSPKDPSAPKDPTERAMQYCLRQVWQNCRVYAVDDRVVYLGSAGAQLALPAIRSGPPGEVAQTSTTASGEFRTVAEGLVQTFACNAPPKLIAKAVTFETYSVACPQRDPLILRCDGSGCSQMK